MLGHLALFRMGEADPGQLEHNREDAPMTYTYLDGYLAHYAGRHILVPDQVAASQRAYVGRTFPAFDAGKKIRVRLDGDAYGLHTAGTGDMICRAA